MNLSHSKIRTFEDCSMKFKYKYINHYYASKKSANLEFGKAVHKALEKLFMEEIDPVKTFVDIWSKFEDIELEYSRYDNFEKLMKSGRILMQDFMENEYEKFVETLAAENWLKFDVDEQTKFFGRGDWTGKVITPDGELVTAIVDFKTSGRKYDDTKVNFNDQLTAYYHARKRFSFDIDKVAYLVFIKTKEPKIQWLFADRTEEQEKEYLEKIREDYRQIMEGKFYREYGMSCKWCDYAPLCLGDKKKAKEELEVFLRDENITLIPGETHVLGKCPPDISPMKYVKNFVKKNNIEGDFGLRVHKDYESHSQWFDYWLDGKELKRIYQKDKDESEVA